MVFSCETAIADYAYISPDVVSAVQKERYSMPLLSLFLTTLIIIQKPTLSNEEIQNLYSCICHRLVIRMSG
jgi:hypothetical protein